MRILLIEPDTELANTVETLLSSEGFNVYTTDLGEEGIDLGKLYDYDLIVLEINLPDMSGLDVLKELRSSRVATPILTYSGLLNNEGKIRAFSLGSDDFLSKPFEKDELVARIHAIIRRSKGYSSHKIATGNIVLDLDKKTVEVEGRRVHLTGREYQMLELFSLRKGTTITKAMLLNHLFGGLDEPELKTIDVFVVKLRKKLAKANSGNHYIETVWGRGYVLRDPEYTEAKSDSKTMPERPAPDIRTEAPPKSSSNEAQPARTTEPALVFLSHANEDKARLKELIHELLAAGFALWIDQPRSLGLQTDNRVLGLRSFENWQDSIADALNSAPAVIVFWSRASCQRGRDELHDEARRAKSSNKLLQVALDPLVELQLPLGFEQRQVLPFADELERVSAGGVMDASDLVRDLRALLARQLAELDRGYDPGSRQKGARNRRYDNNSRSAAAEARAAAAPVELRGPVDAGWQSDGRVHTTTSQATREPIASNLLKHVLDALVKPTAELAEMVQSGEAQARRGYCELFHSYGEELAKEECDRNPIALEFRYMEIFLQLKGDDYDVAPAFRAKVISWMKTHTSLREHYPVIRDYYSKQQLASANSATPIGAANAFREVVGEEMEFFDSSVDTTFSSVPNLPAPSATTTSDVAPSGPGARPPFRDPLVEEAPRFGRAIWLSETVNAVWRAFLSPPPSIAGSDRWKSVLNRLQPYAATVVAWLRGLEDSPTSSQAKTSRNDPTP